MNEKRLFLPSHKCRPSKALACVEEFEHFNLDETVLAIESLLSDRPETQLLYIVYFAVVHGQFETSDCREKVLAAISMYSTVCVLVLLFGHVLLCTHTGLASSPTLSRWSLPGESVKLGLVADTPPSQHGRTSSFLHQ